jgi:hypothetical protein
LNSSISNSGRVRLTKSCGPRGSGADVVEIAAQPVTGAHGFPGDDLITGNEGLGGTAQIQDDGAALGLLDQARDQFALAQLVGLDHLGALGVAHLLHDHLLGGLGGDTAPQLNINGILDDIPHLQGGIAGPGLGQGDLGVGILQSGPFFGVLDHLPAPEGMVFAGGAIDGHAGIRLAAELLARSRGQGRLHGVEDDLLGHILLIRDGLDD